MKDRKPTYALLGFIIGLIIPIGCLALRAFFLRRGFGLPWASFEISSHIFFYSYMAVMTPLFFCAGGFFIGLYEDRFEANKISLQNANLSLRDQSIMDELTGFYNRRHLLSEIQKELDRARRYNHTLVGIMIDVDDFKKLNDRGGHLFGDQVLKEAASIFDHCIRSIDILGRYGGDEFIIILPEANLETGHLVADRINKAIASHEFKIKNRRAKVTVSIGVHFFDDLTDVDKFLFIEKIDKSLLQAKTLGKNRAFSQNAPIKKSSKEKD